MKKNDKLPMIIAGVIMFCLIGGFMYRRLSFMTEKNLCKETVLNTLKTPGSAVFGGLKGKSENVMGVKLIKGYVDSQNSFGATLRIKFVCNIDSLHSVSLYTDQDGDTSSYETYLNLIDHSYTLDQKSDVMKEQHESQMELLNEKFDKFKADHPQTETK